MAKKKSAKKKPTKKPVRLTRVPISREEFLEHLIKVSESSVTGKGGGIDEVFTQQANKLKKELAELRAAK